MSAGNTMDRREFIRMAGSAAVAGSMAACRNTVEAWNFFTDEEAKIAEAICEQIIPADRDPGAAWAGAARFIDRQLVGFYAEHQTLYRKGLAGVQEISMAKFGKPFVELEFDRQTEILTALEKNQAPGETWKHISAGQFFNLILEHTMQGYYGSPRHGGNRAAASWRMLGLPHPPIRGRYHYDLTQLADSRKKE